VETRLRSRAVVEAGARTTVRTRALSAWHQHNARQAPQAREAGRDVDAAEPLQPIGLHEARHTCASTFIAAGANAKVIQTVMGHATIQMTFDRYGHLMPGGLEEPAAAADAYLSRVA
jgi:integrase